MERKKYQERRLVTTSIWGNPHPVYYRFLRTIECSGMSKNLAVLGCSDGKYVIPAAKRGFTVLAIDQDPVAIWGGKVNIGNNVVESAGLVERVTREGVAEYCSIMEGDFLQQNPTTKYSGVYTSGSIHYEENSQYKLDEVIKQIQSFVSENGFLLIEYILRSDKNIDQDRHFVTTDEIARFFKDPLWRVTSNKKKTYIEGPNPRDPDIHTISWGRLYARKGAII